MSEVAGLLYYFQDTLINDSSVLSGNLVSLKTAQRDTVKTAKDSVKPKPTPEQIRYWHWLREKKLTVNGSRYIKPRETISLVSSVKHESSKLGLPVRERNSYNTDWLTLLFLLGLVLLAMVRFFYSKYVASLFQSLINYSTSSRLFRERNYPILHGSTQLNIIFYFSFSLFVFQVINYFTPGHYLPGFYQFAITTGAVFSYFLLKKIVYYSVGLMFESVSETSEYLFNIDIFNRTLGIVLFPVVALINYYPAKNPLFMLVVGVFVVFVFYVFLIRRGAFILLRKQFSIFYLFLYLCTLEILPLLLILKVIVRMVGEMYN